MKNKFSPSIFAVVSPVMVTAEPTMEAMAMRHQQFNTKNKADFNEASARIAAFPVPPAIEKC